MGVCVRNFWLFNISKELTRSAPILFLHFNLLHLSQVGAYLEFGTGRLGDGLQCLVGRQFEQSETLGWMDTEDGLVGDDEVSATSTGQGQVARGDDLGFTILRIVLGCDDDSSAGHMGRDQIHGAAHAFNQLAGDHPIGEVTVL